MNESHLTFPQSNKYQSENGPHFANKCWKSLAKFRFKIAAVVPDLPVAEDQLQGRLQSLYLERRVFPIPE